jgi:hypothetical protein
MTVGYPTAIVPPVTLSDRNFCAGAKGFFVAYFSGNTGTSKCIIIPTFSISSQSLFFTTIPSIT